MKNLILILTLLISQLPITAQDLIKNIQNSTTPAQKKAEPNRIYKQIESSFSDSNYTKIAPLTLNENSGQLMKQHNSKVSDAVFLNINSKVINQWHTAKHQNVQVDIPVANGKNIPLLLSKKDVFTPDFKVTTSSGSALDLEQYGGVFYHGVVEGHPGSIAAISVFPGSIRALISDDNGNYTLARVGNKERTNKAPNDAYVLYNDHNLKVGLDGLACEDTEFVESSAKTDLPCTHVTPTTPPPAADYYVGVYLECEYRAFSNLFNSSVLGAYAHIASTFNETALIFSMEGMNIKQTQLHITTTLAAQDPTLDSYIAAPSIRNEVLDVFSNLKKDNYNGRLAGLVFDNRAADGTHRGEGLANAAPYDCDNNNIDVAPVCQNYWGDASNPQGPYFIISPDFDFQDFPVFSLDVWTLAHEMGHNFGSRHTRRCVWGPNNNQAIDDCASGIAGGYVEPDSGYDCSDDPLLGGGPTVMSNCWYFPLTNGFGEYPGDLIRSNYNKGCGNRVLDCDIDIFSKYPWLLNYVDPDNCSYGQKVTTYYKGVTASGTVKEAIFVETPSSNKLFWYSGSLLCENPSDADCTPLSYYSLTDADILDQWECMSEGFETGFGIWNDYDGAGDRCIRAWNTNQSASGNYSVRLRNRYSRITTDPLALENADGLYVNFSFIGRSMEGNETFRLQMSTNGGSNWSNVKSWRFVLPPTPDDANSGVTDGPQSTYNVHPNVRYYANVEMPTNLINNTILTNNTVLRIVSAWNIYHWDYYFIDDIHISTCPINGSNLPLLRKDEIDEFDLRLDTDHKAISLYPNPTENVLNIEIEGIELASFKEEFNYEIYSFDGRLAKQGITTPANNMQIDVNDLTSNQTYLIKIQTTDGEIFTDKFVKN